MNTVMSVESVPSLEHVRRVDLANAVLSIILGTNAAIVASVAAVSGSAVLAGVSAFSSLALALIGVWQSSLRRSAEAEAREYRAEVARLTESIERQRQTSEATAIVPTEAEAPRGGPARQRDLAAADCDLDGLAADDGGVLNDPITGLLGEDYFVLTLHARVAYARRHLRPLSLILLDVMEGVGADTQPHHAYPTDVAGIVATTLRDADTVCRLRQGRFGLILEDTNETGAIWTVERIRRELNAEFAGLTVWAGVACYPAHGFDGPEMFNKATGAIESARDWFQDRTEVASA